MACFGGPLATRSCRHSPSRGQRQDPRASTKTSRESGPQGVFGTPVHEIEGRGLSLGGLPQAGDLFADPAFALNRAIAKQARALGVPVLLSGQGETSSLAAIAGIRAHPSSTGSGWAGPATRWRGRSVVCALTPPGSSA